MQVLGIETSSFALGIALVEDDKIVFELLMNADSPQSEMIVQLIREWVPKPEKIDGFAVSLGPGSFTGLRVGLATAKGLATALGTPIIGVPTLDAFAAGLPCTKYKITPIVDARMGDIYTATYVDSGKRVSAYTAISPDELLDSLDGEHLFVGNAVETYSGLIQQKLGNRARFIRPNPESPRASSVASIGIERLKNGEEDPIDSIEPIYLHPPRIRRIDEEKSNMKKQIAK
jgi:tRNA threonylcarbamoyladenosine biosynthesis protein TsaB